MRRCGGQGDILAGALGVFSHWAEMNKGQLKHFGSTMEDLLEVEVLLGGGSDCDVEEEDDFPDEYYVTIQNVSTLWSCTFASSLVRRASKIAFTKKRRSMMSPDVIDAIGDSFESLMSRG